MRSRLGEIWNAVSAKRCAQRGVEEIGMNAPDDADRPVVGVAAALPTVDAAPRRRSASRSPALQRPALEAAEPDRDVGRPAAQHRRHVDLAVEAQIAVVAGSPGVISTRRRRRAPAAPASRASCR